MQHLLQRMQKIKIWLPNGKTLRLVYSYYEDHELEQYGIDHDEADYGLYIMQDIRNNQLVALIKKVGIYIKGSLRGRGEIDCSELARFFGGWGHQNAAGFKIQGSGNLDQDVQMIITKIESYFQA